MTVNATSVNVPVVPNNVDDIDIEALRKKYSHPREELQQAGVGTVTPDALSKGANSDKLTELVMCQGCQALGTVKKQYGYRVIDEVCEQCDGEGCFVKGQGKKASRDLKEKVKQVEALVAACEDLDELEKLEEALQKRTIASLEAVLKSHRMAAFEKLDAKRPTAAEVSPRQANFRVRHSCTMGKVIKQVDIS